ncbi:GDSL-type esterase/lipase family protein [Kitasatospora gansuensis]
MLENSRSVTRRITGRAATALAAAVLTAPLLALATPAQAATGPTASVTLGDSYISGEAGRWKGNSVVTSGSRAGTDRAWNGSSYDPSRAYGTSYANGCDRSDSAEVRSATGIAQTQINLACSGAVSANVFRAANGGQSYKGELPQADQLAAVAAANDVKLITLSIGGNDLGFADVIETCVKDYLIWYSYCHDDQQEAVDSRMPAAMAGVGKSIDEIRAVMSTAYSSSAYRIVLQSYPSPIPRGADMRYSESGWSRADTGGCPFWNGDADWARSSLVPQISDELAKVAKAKGVQFLDLRDMLAGREVCSKATKQATSTTAPSATTSEWARFVDAYLSASQGDTRESMHPNYYGQLALGRCLTLLWAKPTGDQSCRNTVYQDATGMYLTAR